GFRQNECTSYAAGKRPDFFVAVLKNAPRPRHAKYWAQFASASGWKVDTSPLDGAIVVWETGSSKLLQEYGHVAVVETYDRTSDTITVGEKNWDGKGTESHGRKIQNASSIGLKYIGPRSETAHPPASNSQPGATPSAAPSSPPATATSEPARSTSSSTPILFLTRDERMQEPAEKVVKAAGLTDVYIFSYPRDIDNYKQLAKEKNTPDDYVKKYLSGASGRGVSDKSYTRSIMIKPGASSPDAIAFTIGHELAHLIEKKLEVTVEDMQRFFPADYKRWKASMDKNYQERALKIEDRIIAYMERDKEAQADLQGLKWAEQAGYSVDEMLRVFGGTSSKVLSLLHEFSDIILKYLFVTDTPDSHYADSERLKRLERWVDGLGGGGSW
ncbi:MAG: CHAP domain-containing protein, partial [Armatimonadetes bacterium]|nr:CHAP domain-containing protein [Armatimonadota bacterium]